MSERTKNKDQRDQRDQQDQQDPSDLKNQTNEQDMQKQQDLKDQPDHQVINDQMPSLEYVANPNTNKNAKTNITEDNSTSLPQEDIHLSIIALQMARARMNLDPAVQAKQAQAQQNIVRRLSIVKEKIEELKHQS